MIKQIARYITPKLNLIVKQGHPKAHILEMAKLNKKDIIAVEIGTWEGTNAKYMLKYLDIKKLFLIDPYDTYKEYTDIKDKKVLNSESIAHKKLKKWENKIVWIKDYSSESANKIPDADLIYIDGNHNYDFVKQDIELYYPKVKEGGILAGHDIDWKDGQIFKAVSEFCVANNLKCIIKNTDWIVFK